MAQYWEDWSVESVGAITAPAGWTKRWAAANATLSIVSEAEAPAGKALRITKTATDRFLLTFDEVSSDANRANCEVRLLVRMTETVQLFDGLNVIGAVGRASGDSAAETGYIANAYVLSESSVLRRKMRIAEYNSGTGNLNQAVSTVGVDRWTAGALHWVRLTCSGTTITWGIATAAAPETEVTGSITDTSISAAGWVGIFGFLNTTSTVDVLAVGVGTNGDAAPIEAPVTPDTTAPTLSGASGTKTGATSATGSVTTDEGNGTLYAVSTTSATAPSAAQVKAGQTHTGATAPWAGSQAVSSTGSKSVTVTGLSASTTYYLHYMHEDAAANQSTVATSSGFTTDTPDTTAPTLTSPTATATWTTTASASVSTNEASGTLYYLASTSATATATAVKAASSQSVTATGSQSVSITGLSAETSYYVHFVHRDSSGNDSAVATSAQITMPEGISIRADYERSSVNLAGSSVSGAGSDATITIKPRVQESEVESSQTRWLEPSARIDGVNGYRPTFKFTDYAATPSAGKYHGAPWASTRKPMFSYDRETWHYFDSVTVGTSDITFRHSTAFTSSTVYIGRSRQMSVMQVGEWLEAMAGTYTGVLYPAPSALVFTPTLTTWPAQAFIAGEFSAQTNELGSEIQATPFYAAQVGNGSTLAILSCGVHAGEDHADYLYRATVEYLCGSSAEAVSLRSRYTVLLYPMVNAPGRAGGGWRGSFTQGTSGEDDLNRHFSESDTTLEIIDVTKGVMLSDVGTKTPSWCFDFHALLSMSWGMYQGDSVAESFRTKIAAATGYTIQNLGSFTADALGSWYGSELGATLFGLLEFGDPVGVSDSQIQAYATGAIETIEGMSTDKDIPWDWPVPISLAFSDSAPATLLTVQVWSKVPTKANVEGLY